MTTDIDVHARYNNAVEVTDGDPITPEARLAIWDANNDAAIKRINNLELVQRERRDLYRLLDCGREDLDGEWRWLAYAYITEVREHGNADLDALLEMTDRQLEDRCGVMAWPQHDDEVMALIRARLAAARAAAD